MGHILIVDDEKSISDLIVMNLTMVGHTTEQAFDGKEALEKIRTEHFDLCLLDIMLPGKDGFELIDDFKKSTIPVIYLSAKNSLTDRVKGLQLGAEDYIIKPFETLELIVRIDVVLRREGKDKNIFTYNNVVVDMKKHLVLKNDKEIELTAQEYSLLEAMIQNQNLALTREQLLSIAWGYDYSGETRTVDMHIQRLRKKLGWEDIIKTVYKFGYRLEVPRT
ncbi:response regulator transcription factor [Anaeromicropila herbilytica]|uniref:Stage 0 sporulation protein A homolog n=1 Tax=Anaeromicropila herbilytica TaxID=2785025 RepID=A0A7R7IF21_9FIRM|nr:response regulator transcription factor [Anaeromicropila herbilytica]BCN32719.1 DNA-binding response regulator [Anaeromicropila herbilytica]